ncbi:hypothetical protein ACNTMW_31735 [Planosporangium sp. 12N6]|uniref:hypothetical protein n=1 Tax=Planosporangium spinosum TaxID=3402278 RepID=UPI003CEF96AD
MAQDQAEGERNELQDGHGAHQGGHVQGDPRADLGRSEDGVDGRTEGQAADCGEQDLHGRDRAQLGRERSVVDRIRLEHTEHLDVLRNDGRGDHTDGRRTENCFRSLRPRAALPQARRDHPAARRAPH